MSVLSDSVKRVLWTFGQSFLAVFLPGVIGLLDNVADAVTKRSDVDLSTLAAALVALVVAAIAAGFSAIKNIILKPGATAR